MAAKTTGQKQEILMRRLGELLSHNLGYIWGERESGPNGEKKEFLDKGKRFLTQLGKDLGFTEMKVSKNPAGIAVSGEVTLMGTWSKSNGLYVQLSEPAFGNYCVLYREIKHLMDYTGGRNNFLTVDYMNDTEYRQLVALFTSYYTGNVEDDYGTAA